MSENPYDRLREEFKARERHELRVTVVGGGVGLLLSWALLWVATISDLWAPIEASLVGVVVGPLLVFSGVIIAHEIDDRKRKKERN